ncbi:hypothetical protein SK128_008436 [Halocaridina rubra]|uniref:Glucosylceramidase n=1 Tax=Halocaridina rubra TaxID=373956 RepID=A0AAN9AFL9_HALRR
MGGCDFSWRPYTYADTEGDIDLNTFQLQPEDLDYKIPVIKRAIAMTEKGIKLYASPWSAPPWMKTNNDYSGFGQLLEEMYQPWANYFVKFLESYASQNISMWGLTAQNEPVDGYVPGFNFNCMGWTAEQQRKWIAENLGPALEASGFGDVILMIMDDQRYELPHWAEVVLNDSVAEQYVDGIALHWYGNPLSNPDRLNQTHDLFPTRFILGTEACAGFGGDLVEESVHLGSWERLESYAHDIIVDINHWVTGWTDWNLALDMQGGPNWANMSADSPIIVNAVSDEFYKNPMFYAMGHFSKFVKEGAVRLDLSSNDSHNLDATAFQNEDGSTVIVILNRAEAEYEVRIDVSVRGTMTLMVGPRSLQSAIFI